MDIKIKPLAEFDKEYKRLSKKYHSLFGEIRELGEALKLNPKQGKPLGANLFKIRLASASKGKGKRGGFRVITYYLEETKDESILYLTTIYDKSEVSDIPKSQLLQLLKNANLR